MENERDRHDHDEQTSEPHFQSYDLAEIRRTPGYRIEVGDAVHITLVGKPEEDIPQGETSIAVLQLDVHTYNCLKRASLHYVSQVIELDDSELLALRNFNVRCLANLREQLNAHGFQQ